MTGQQRVVRVPIYWLIVGIVTTLVSPVLSVVASARINANTVQRTIAANEASRQEARAEALVRYCRLLGSQVDVYAEATTDVGKEARQVWLAEYQRNGCVPPRK